MSRSEVDFNSPSSKRSNASSEISFERLDQFCLSANAARACEPRTRSSSKPTCLSLCNLRFIPDPRAVLKTMIGAHPCVSHGFPTVFQPLLPRVIDNLFRENRIFQQRERSISDLNVIAARHDHARSFVLYDIRNAAGVSRHDRQAA